MSAGFYSLKENALEPRYLRNLTDEILDSQYLGASPLGKEFVNSKGFSLVFQRCAMAELISHFPYLTSYLDTVLFESCNAFYLNPLILENASRVDPHIDCRHIATGDIRIIPNLVSILYLEVSPGMRGGDLNLNVGNENEVVIRPKQNDLIHFLGSIIHSVNQVETPSRRISIVCEQYNLPEDALSGFPIFSIITDGDLVPRVDALSHS